MESVKIAFVGNFQFNCGSSNTLLGYIRAGGTMGHDVRASEFGYIDNIMRKRVPIADRKWEADLFVIVYETYPFLSQTDLDQIIDFVPRSKRVVIDPDGKYLPPASVPGDTNHDGPDSFRYWTSLYDSLTDRILQPTIGDQIRKNVYRFLYFGIDKNSTDNKNAPKEFDVLYVGNNWYRWNDIRQLVDAISPIRSKIGKVALMGSYWLGEVMPEFKDAVYTEPEFLKINNIEVYKSASYGQVEMAMSRGRLNPILIRPILNHLGLVTPRMFETIAADTVPLLPSYFSYALDLFGEDADKLLMKNPSDHVLNVLGNYEEYKTIVRKIRARFLSMHTYEKRVEELLRFI